MHFYLELLTFLQIWLRLNETQKSEKYSLRQRPISKRRFVEPPSLTWNVNESLRCDTMRKGERESAKLIEGRPFFYWLIVFTIILQRPALKKTGLFLIIDFRNMHAFTYFGEPLFQSFYIWYVLCFSFYIFSFRIAFMPHCFSQSNLSLSFLFLSMFLSCFYRRLQSLRFQQEFQTGLLNNKF